jgi:Smg protein
LRERVLAIVSIIAQYVIEDRDFLTESDIVEQLLADGFAADEIDAAFSWMESLSMQARSTAASRELSQPTYRIFTPEEGQVFTQDAMGFLIRLRSLGILDNDLQEEIIDKALRMSEEEVTLKEIKALTALTLFTRTQDDWHREVDCFMEDDWARICH